MNIETAKFLVSEKAKAIYSFLDSENADSLAAGKMLRKKFPDLPPEYLSAAVEIVCLRKKGTEKFRLADKMFFVKEALEQASGEKASSHRAERFIGTGSVCDLCSGIGGDAITIGKNSRNTVCVESDPVRALFCSENLRINGINGSVINGTAENFSESLKDFDAFFMDPSRRKGGRRIWNMDDIEPSVSFILSIIDKTPGAAVKLPGFADPETFGNKYEIEWVSDRDSLKEAVLWCGNLKRAGVTVTLLHKGVSMTDGDLPGDVPYAEKAGKYIYEPDPALIRSGLLGRKTFSLGMHLIDSTIAYTTSDHPVRDPFFTSYSIIESFKFNLRRLNDALNALDIGNLTVKKRGFPMLPEDVISKMKLKGRKKAVVILTKELGVNTAYIVERLPE